MSIVVLILLFILCIVLCVAFLDYMGFLLFFFFESFLVQDIFKKTITCKCGVLFLNM